MKMLLVNGSPVYFAGPNGALCALLDRVFYATCTYSQLFRGKIAAALVTCEIAGGTAALDRLHRYFIPNQMNIVTSNGYTAFPFDIADNNKSLSENLVLLADNIIKFSK